MSKRKRQHPIVIFTATGKRLKSMLIPLIGLIAFGGRGNEKEIVSLVMSGITVIIILLTGILSWLRYTYRMEDDELRIDYGIIVRTKKYIPLERIQSIDISEGLVQRILGLVRVQIETAGGGRSDEPEAVLTAISKKEARLIQDFVTLSKKGELQRSEGETEEQREILYKISMNQLVLLSLTSGGIGVIISGVLAFLSQLDDIVHFNKMFGGLEKWAAGNLTIILLIVFFCFVIIWAIALVRTMLKFANFTVSKTEKELIIFRGFIERRQITIPLKRIQAIRINESLLRQMLGLGTVYIESAGGSHVNEGDAKVLLLPIIRMKDIGDFLEQTFTDYRIPLLLHPAPTRALQRYVLRSSYVTVPIVILSLIFLKQWGIISFVILAIGLIWAFLKYRDAGWSLDGQQLVLRSRSIVRTTLIMRKNRIQSLKMRESYFQRKRELATIEAYVKSGAGPEIGEVIDLEKKDVKEIYQWYSQARK